jgi:uncharacterized protein (TIGR02594 family)
MQDPKWLETARSYIGVAETPGKATAPTIQRWLLGLKAWWYDDETPWCGVFVAECMKESNIKLPAAWFRAKGWLDWGIPIYAPIVGCVVVYERTGGGHVGLVVGRDELGRLMTLGGNQGNKVGIAPFDMTRVLGYRWPAEFFSAIKDVGPMPVLTANGQPVSHNEA